MRVNSTDSSHSKCMQKCNHNHHFCTLCLYKLKFFIRAYTENHTLLPLLLLPLQASIRFRLCNQNQNRNLPHKHWSIAVCGAEWKVITWLSEAALAFRMKNRIIPIKPFSHHFNEVNCRFKPIQYTADLQGVLLKAESFTSVENSFLVWIQLKLGFFFFTSVNK